VTADEFASAADACEQHEARTILAALVDEHGPIMTVGREALERAKDGLTVLAYSFDPTIGIMTLSRRRR